MQTKGFHVVMEDDVFAEVEQLGIWLVVREQATHVEPQLLEDTLFYNAVTVEQVREEGVAVDGLQVGFLDGKLSGTLHIA